MSGRRSRQLFSTGGEGGSWIRFAQGAWERCDLVVGDHGLVVHRSGEDPLRVRGTTVANVDELDVDGPWRIIEISLGKERRLELKLVDEDLDKLLAMLRSSHDHKPVPPATPVLQPPNRRRSIREAWAVIGVALGVVLLFGWCSASSDRAPRSGTVAALGPAFCADLRSGLTPMNILTTSVRDGTYTADEAALRAWMWSSEHCPEQLEGNWRLRQYVQDFGHDPDQPYRG